MKSRPRKVENRVAEEINKYLSKYKLSEVERIPVLGRTGPDISIWPEFEVAVDVKSRIACPKSYILHGDHLQEWGHEVDNEEIRYVGCRLCDLDMLFDIENVSMHLIRPASKVVSGWLGHMRTWCVEQEKKKNYYLLPALVLHWPNTPVKNSTFVIYEEDRRALNDRRKCSTNDL